MKKNLSLVVFMMIGIAFAAGLTVAQRQIAQPTSPASSDVVEAPPQSGARPSLSTPTSSLPDLSTVAERAIKASANISSTTLVRVNPFFEMFSGERVRPQQSLGSGVIVSADGYILTNSHVVLPDGRNSTRPEIQVTLPDNRELPAKIIAIDELTDLAVMKVEATGLTPLSWGDSSRLRVAEWVLAVGNPFQFNRTVTLGIVSAVNRNDPQLAAYNDFIQTDAAINPGNSGGALVNIRGELIGINTMIYSGTGGYQGLGFAIPVNLARRVFDELLKDGEVRRGSIGQVDLRTVDPERARRAGLGAIRGVLVYDMASASAANRAGLRLDDIILKIDGIDVTSAEQLNRLVADTDIGKTLKMDVLREGRRLIVNVPVQRATRL